MQTNETKQTKGDTGSPLRSMTKIPDSFLLVREHERQIRRDTNFFRGIMSYLGLQAPGWQGSNLVATL